MPPLTDRDVGALATDSGALSSTGRNVRSAAALLYGWQIINGAAAVTYIQFFDALAADVTLGTTAPKLSIGIESLGKSEVELDKPIKFATAISVFSTTTRAGSTSAASDGNFFFG